MKSLLVIVLAVYAAIALFAYLAADRLIFLPPPASYSPADLAVTHVATDDGVDVAVMHLPNPAAEFTILYSHGNAEDLGHLAPLLEDLRDAGFAVIAYDYRGYGASGGGPPSAAGAYRDHRAAYRFAVDGLGIPPARIVPLGRSVGSGPAIELAAHEPVGGLIVESGFVSAFRVVTHLPVLPFDRFPNLKRMREIAVPVLVVHGTDDEVIPARHGRRLYAAAPGPKQAFWVERARHNDLAWVAGERYGEALREFLELLREHHGLAAER